MINPAVVVYSFLLKLRRFDKTDAFIHVLFFVYALGATFGGEKWIHFFLDAIMSPVVLVLVAFRFTSDNYKSGEYFALLFTRPIRRVDYVVSKAVAGWLGTQLFVYKFILCFLVTETMFGISPMVLPDGWDLLSLSVNAFSASCLSLLLCKLPEKVSSWALLLVTGSYFGLFAQSSQSGLLFEHGGSKSFEVVCSFMSSLFYPFVDAQTIFYSTAPTLAPALSWLSDVLIYVVIATWLLNRKEFPYVQND